MALAASGFLAPAAAAPAASRPLPEAHEAHAVLIWNRDLLAERGLALAPEGERLAPLDPQYRAAELKLAGALALTLESGHLVRARAGALALPRAIVLRNGARALPLDLELRAARGGDTAFELADRAGKVWFTVHYVHQFAEADQVGLANLDVRLGPALAAWARHPAWAGLAVGAMHVDLPVGGAAKSLDATSSCDTPNWPGTPGYTTDVGLVDVSQLQAQCAGGCDGAGTSPTALVKIVPWTQLANLGTADVPWYGKFSTPTPPGAYPYATLDQHPILVWNAYRKNADGSLEQIGRSGAKHAFATSNDFCECADSHILAPGCGDVYGTYSNDGSNFIGPRREIIASRGIWGRCRSSFDPDCDGIEDQRGLGNFDERLVVHESELSAAQHPGASYYLEAWYVVRDDANIYDTMGWRTFTPGFAAGAWSVPVGPVFQNGPVIDQWVAPDANAPMMRSSELVTPDGRLKLAVRVTALGGGSYRYDYALMDFDFGIAVTNGVEPNLEVVRNRGFSALSVPIPAGTSVQSMGFHDGDRDALDDWTPTVSGGVARWTAPVGASLDWGAMYTFSLVANAPPQTATATLTVAETGAMADPLLASIGPGVGDTIFADGVE